MLLRQVSSGTDCKRAGASRLTRDIYGNCQAFTKAEIATALQDKLLLCANSNQLVELAPLKSAIRAPAREMDRIVRCKAASDDFGSPIRGVIVDANIAATWMKQAGMVEQSEIIETELARGIRQHIVQLGEAVAVLCCFTVAFRQASQRLAPAFCDWEWSRKDTPHQLCTSPVDSEVDTRP